MVFENFDQLFRFRNKCLCGSNFRPSFLYSSFSDEYVDVFPVGSYRVDNLHNHIVFPFRMESRAHPYGEVSFQINAHLYDDRFSIQTKSFTRTVSSPTDFVIRHFNHITQRGLNIRMTRECGGTSCPHRYLLVSSPLEFNMMSRKLNPIHLDRENFCIVNDQHEYVFNSKFDTGQTVIQANTKTQTTTFELESDKFLRYDFEKEFLLEKVKTLVLFS